MKKFSIFLALLIFTAPALGMDKVSENWDSGFLKGIAICIGFTVWCNFLNKSQQKYKEFFNKRESRYSDTIHDEIKQENNVGYQGNKTPQQRYTSILHRHDPLQKLNNEVCAMAIPCFITALLLAGGVTGYTAYNYLFSH